MKASLMTRGLMKPGELLVSLLTFFALTISMSVQADQAGGERSHRADKTVHGVSAAADVSYDRVSDQLSVVAEKASLKSVLGEIARQSGIEVMFDEMAEESVSAEIRSETLEAGLKQLLRGRNSMMRYSRDESQKLLLVGVMVLPEGEQDSGRARRIVAMDDEAINRARNKLSLEQTQQLDLSNERWQARLAELPPERRDKLEKQAEARLLKQAQHEQQRAENKIKYEQKRAEHEQKLKAAQEKALSRLSPEERSDFERRGKAAHDEVKALLLKSRTEP